MNVQVVLFAGAREAVDQKTVDVAVPDRTTVGQLREALKAQFPALAPILSGVRFAIDQAYVDDQTEVKRGAVVAVIPLVSGG